MVPITAVTGMTSDASPNWIGDQPRTSCAYWVRMNGTPNPCRAEREEVAPDQRARPEHAQRRQRSDRARLDADEHRGQDRGEREQAQRPAVGPTGLWRLDDRVDERHEGDRDRRRAGDVEAPPPHCRAALAQEHQAQGGHDGCDGHVDEEDPLPAQPGRDRAADQPRGGPADGAGRAPDPERPVALGALREGGHEDRQRGRGHDRRRRHALEPPERRAAPRRYPPDPTPSEANANRPVPAMNIRRRPRRSAARPPSRTNPPS